MLTEKEQRMVEYILQGDNNKMIAHKMKIPYKCIGVELQRFWRKHEAVDKTTLIINLFRKQLITL